MDDYLNIQADFLDDLAADELNEDRARKLRSIAATLRGSPVRGLIAKVERMHAELEAAKAEAASLRDKLDSACALIDAHNRRIPEKQLQAAIDAAMQIIRTADTPQGACYAVSRMLGPHESRPPHATPTPTLDASAYAKPQRQWSSTPPADRSGKWWHAFGGSGVRSVELVPDVLDWPIALLKALDYNLWLLWQEGDTKGMLPPLPKSPATVADSATVGSPKPDDTRELVARLAEANQ